MKINRNERGAFVALAYIAIWFVLCAGMLFFVSGKAKALDKPIDGIEQGSTWVALLPDMTCRAGSKFNVPYHVIFSDWLPNTGETFGEYLDRKDREIFNRPMTPEESALCDTLKARNTIQWVVQQYRDKPDRPVKRIVNGFVDSSDTIGRIAYGEPCGNEVESGTRTMWREVIITYPDGTQIIGASVCEQVP